MAVDAAALEAAKRYMRVEDDKDDEVISALYDAAAEYLKDAGIERSDANGARYDLAVRALTLYYYDHRDDVGGEAAFPVGLRPVLNQLKIMASVETEAAT